MQAAADSTLDRARPTLPRVVDPRFAWAVGLALAAVCAALWLAGWNARGWISAWPRFQDDAYYYLVIARNVAAGHGFTMDQLSPTNGFQPLWQWLLIPVARVLGADPSAYLAGVQALCVALFALAGGLLCGLIRARLGLVPALLAALLLLMPRFLNTLISGMESAVLFLVLVLLAIEALRSLSLQRTEPAFRDARTGALVGLLMLARLDAVFVGLTLAAFVGFRGLVNGPGDFGARLTRTIRKELAVFWPVLVLIVPYLAWNQLAFGHWMPISGALKTSFPVAGFEPAHVRVEYAGLVVIALLAVAREYRRGNGGDPLVGLLAPLAIGLALHAVWTVVYMNWAVFAWHFAACVPVGIVGAALLARDVAARIPGALVAVALVGLLVFQVTALTVSISRLGRTFTVAGREAGLWVAANLPPESVLAMKDSGTFSYFAQRQVMNLDGVANSFAFAEAVCQGRLEEFVRERGVRYIAQHSVPPQVRIGAYETFVQKYPCRLPGGTDGTLELRRDLELFRGTPYANDAGRLDQLFIWRLSPTEGVVE
jgi:hypothetical protein